MKKSKPLSVIIPVRSKVPGLDKVVNTIEGQLIDNDQLILLDYGTQPVPKPNANRLKYIRHRSTEAKALNNIIYKQVTNDFIVLLDPFCVPQKNYLNSFRKHIDSEVVVYGRIDEYTDSGKILKDKRVPPYNPFNCNPSNLGLPKEKILKVGLFNEQFKRPDRSASIVLCYMLSKIAEVSIVYEDEARVIRKSGRKFKRFDLEREKMQLLIRKINSDNYKYKDLRKNTVPVSLLIQTDNDELVSEIKKALGKNDEVIVFPAGEKFIGKCLDNTLTSVKNRCVIIFSGSYDEDVEDCIGSLTNRYNRNKIISTKKEDRIAPRITSVTRQTCICFDKSIYRKGIISSKSSTVIQSIKDIIRKSYRNLEGDKMISSIELSYKQKFLDRFKLNDSPSLIEVAKTGKKVKGERLKLERSHEGKKGVISFIIPYMHHPERYQLLMACLESLPNPDENINIEICIVEIGKARHLFNLEPKYKYIFAEYDSDIMHRGWALNLGVRSLSSGEKIVLVDSDLVLTKKWYKEVEECNHPTVAWGKLHYLTAQSTRKYLENRKLKGLKIDKVKSPRISGAAGGATVIPRNIFYAVKGVPEDFEGTWGGPDNTLMAKLHIYGYHFRYFKSGIYHLYHRHRTERNIRIMRQAMPMLGWRRDQWIRHLKKLGDNWGKMMHKDIIYDQWDSKFEDRNKKIEALNATWEKLEVPTLSKVFFSEKPILTLAMISWKRTDKLIRTLNNWLDSLIKPNLVLLVQGNEYLNKGKRDLIRGLASEFNDSLVFFEDGNRGTGYPRKFTTTRALEFDTPFIMTTDDDITIPHGGVEAEIATLMQNPELGAVDMYVAPQLNAWILKENKFDVRPPQGIFSYTDAMGTGTMVMRREVFNKCSFDDQYIIGCVDIDFCMQMKKAGWELAILQLPGYRGRNDNRNSPPDYTSERHNKKIVLESIEKFYKKWGVRIDF